MAPLVISNAKGVQLASRGHQAATHCPRRLRLGSLVGRGREVLAHKAHSSSYIHHARTQTAAGDLSADAWKQENTNAAGDSPGDAQAQAGAAKQTQSRGDPEQVQARPAAQTVRCQELEPAKRTHPIFIFSLLLALLILVKVFVHVCKVFVCRISMAIASFVCSHIDRKRNL